MQELSPAELEVARVNMTKQQVNAWGVNDPRVLDVIQNTHREDFLPTKYKKLAYCDEQLPIGNGFYATEPKLIGKALDSVRITPEDDVLEIGIGTGYLTALIAQLAYHVTSVECEKEFVNNAQKILCDKRISNFHLVHQNVFEYLEQKPTFNVIVCTNATEQIPKEFLSALKPGGRMFAVVGKKPAMHACLWEKDANDSIHVKSLFETVTPYLTGTKISSEFKL